MKLSSFLTLLLLITLTVNINAQSQKLDEKNGFNKFQLGSTLKSIGEIARLKRITDNAINSETYIIKDIENYAIAGYPIQTIALSFYKQKLLQVTIHMPDFYPKEGSKSWLFSKDVEEKITKEYGEWTSAELTVSEKANDIIFKSVIMGNKVCLFMCKHKLSFIGYEPVSKGNIYSFISLEVYNLMEKELAKESGF